MHELENTSITNDFGVGYEEETVSDVAICIDSIFFISIKTKLILHTPRI